MTLPSFNYYKNLIFILLLIFGGTSSLLNASTLTVKVTDKSGMSKSNLKVKINNRIVYTDKNGTSKFEELEDGTYIIKVKEFNRVIRFKIKVNADKTEQLRLNW